MFNEQIIEAVKNARYDEKISNVLVNLMNYMEKNQWIGACYATSTVLYVCLKELGYEPKLCIGEAFTEFPVSMSFDHGWIELDGKIIDLACSMTLLNGYPASPPVIFDKEILSNEFHHIEYGIKGRGLDLEAKRVMSSPLKKYMLDFPNEKGGLFGVVNIVLNHKGSIKNIRDKYDYNPWIYVQNDLKAVEQEVF